MNSLSLQKIISMTQREDKEKEKLKRDKLSGFFLDMAKLTFTAMVLGNLIPLFNGNVEPYSWVTLVFGIAMTFVYALIGYRILK